MDTTNLAIAESVRRAKPADASALAALVNRAYAVEASFVDGDRTTPAEIEHLVRSGNGTFLVLEAGPVLAAAVYVDARPATKGDPGYIGMLSVEPSLQGMGLGTRLVGIAEALCEAMGAPAVRLRIINLREELARWYRGLGYREVGTAPYEHRPTKQPCHFIELQKQLGDGEDDADSAGIVQRAHAGSESAAVA